jgi:hypothetical protein
LELRDGANARPVLSPGYGRELALGLTRLDWVECEEFSGWGEAGGGGGKQGAPDRHFASPGGFRRSIPSSLTGVF